MLGPTNTGKTHHAIERMLEHKDGMIGLPLRLLAREVYDRLTARVGESRVALVTGEEQRVPARPSYWVATTEAMPVEREVDFVAIDEIQLAAHPQRGHVFTSRMLHARGKLETWFLGADTIRGVLQELVPTARIVEHPRLSRLAHAGAVPLARIPPRSAVVAFSMPHVYEIADRIRRRRGGAAVVLGALSPRTRNAQVAMFQSGEVDCIVATDAIGMGLNLDVEHVAFAATRKFDGHDVRDVDDAELGQIAGRAGRWIHDGTFGTLTPVALPSGAVHAIETHSFPRIRRVQWRSEDLDFTSIAALRGVLAEPPRRGILRHAAGADDAACLARLSDRTEIVQRVGRDPERVRLLWDVCTVPDFRKLMIEVHVDLLAELFIELADRGRIRDEWLEARIGVLERSHVASASYSAHDVEELVARTAAVRTWTYVANRRTWLDSPDEWQERTRRLEDRLSDALHERLVMRFVDARRGPATKQHPRRSRDTSRVLADDDTPLAVDPTHPFAKLAAFRSKVAGAAAPKKSVAPGSPAWVEQILEADHDAFTLDETGRIVANEANGNVLGQIVRGGSIALPDVVIALEGLPAGAKSRLQRRLLAFARDVVTDLTGTGALVLDSAPLRAFLHRFSQGLGTVLGSELSDIILAEEERAALVEAGIVFGDALVYLPHGLRPAALSARSALATIWYRSGRALRPPVGGAVSFSSSRGIDPKAFTAIGFPVVGPRAVRADVLERFLALLRQQAASPPESATDLTLRDDPLSESRLASLIGAPKPELRRVIGAARSWH